MYTLSKYAEATGSSDLITLDMCRNFIMFIRFIFAPTLFTSVVSLQVDVEKNIFHVRLNFAFQCLTFIKFFLHWNTFIVL